MLKCKPKTIKKPKKSVIFAKTFIVIFLAYWLLFGIFYEQIVNLLHYHSQYLRDNINLLYQHVRDSIENDGVIDDEEYIQLVNKTITLSNRGTPVVIKVDDNVIFSSENKFVGIIANEDEPNNRHIVYMDWDENLNNQYTKALGYCDNFFEWKFLGRNMYSLSVETGYVNYETKEFYPAKVRVYFERLLLLNEQLPELVETIDLTPKDMSLVEGFTYVKNINGDSYFDGDDIFFFSICGGIRNPGYDEVTWDFDTGLHHYEIEYDKTVIEILDSGTRTIFITVSALIVLFLTVVISAFQYLKAKSIYEIFDYRCKTTASMAHDLKTPLAIASVYVDNFMASVDSNPENAKKHAEKISYSVNYLNSLVNDILKFSNSEDSVKKLKKEDVFVKASFESYFAKVSANLEDNKMTYEVTGDSVRKVDKELWNQAMANIVDNAVKYGSREGKIVVSLSDKEIRVTNPVNTPVENVQSLVEPFVKGDNSRGENSGSGLGLAIAENNLARMGYKLTVECIDNAFSVKIN